MFVVSIGDGLGNQMFHFAFFYAMKKRYSNCRVLFDNYLYGPANKHNGIELDKIFPINIDFCTKKAALSLCDYHGSLKKEHLFLSFIWKLRQIFFGIKTSFIVQDDATCFYPEVFSLNPLSSYYLRGNWVNPKYFDMYRSELLNLFEFPKITEYENIKIMNEISGSISVSIHIRVGDYLNDPSYYLGGEFYTKAIDFICSQLNKRIEELHFFVFSDDIQTSEKLFSYIKNKTIVSCNRGKNSFRDMQLMSLCRHNIIANSTFSFWGAYLNRNQSKIVVAPRISNKNLKNPYACDDWILL